MEDNIKVIQLTSDNYKLIMLYIYEQLKNFNDALQH